MHLAVLSVSKSRALKGQSIGPEGRIEPRRQCQNRTLPPLHGVGAPLLRTGRRRGRAAAFPGVTEEGPSSDINSRAEQSVVTALNVWGAYKSQSLTRGERPLELRLPADRHRKEETERERQELGCTVITRRPLVPVLSINPTTPADDYYTERKMWTLTGELVMPRKPSPPPPPSPRRPKAKERENGKRGDEGIPKTMGKNAGLETGRLQPNVRRGMAGKGRKGEKKGARGAKQRNKRE